MKSARLLTFYFTIFCFSPCLFSQTVSSSVLASQGNTVSANDLVFSYTIGESFITTHPSNGGIQLSEGYQQPLPNGTTGIKTPAPIECFAVTLFPNPASEELRWAIEHCRSASMTIRYRLVDVAGRELSSGKCDITGALALGGFAPGHYVLNFTDPEGRLTAKSFQIIR